MLRGVNRQLSPTVRMVTGLLAVLVLVGAAIVVMAVLTDGKDEPSVPTVGQSPTRATDAPSTTPTKVSRVRCWDGNRRRETDCGSPRGVPGFKNAFPGLARFFKDGIGRPLRAAGAGYTRFGENCQFQKLPVAQPSTAGGIYARCDNRVRFGAVTAPELAAAATPNRPCVDETKGERAGWTNFRTGAYRIRGERVGTWCQWSPSVGSCEARIATEKYWIRFSLAGPVARCETFRKSVVMTLPKDQHIWQR